jgi:hypothetical protein
VCPNLGTADSGFLGDGFFGHSENATEHAIAIGLTEVSEGMERRCSIGGRGAGGELEFWAGMFGLFAAAVVGLVNSFCWCLIGPFAGIVRAQLGSCPGAVMLLDFVQYY